MGTQRACPRKRKLRSRRKTGQQRIPVDGERPPQPHAGLDPGPDLFLEHGAFWNKSADATSDPLPPLDFSRRSSSSSRAGSITLPLSGPADPNRGTAAEKSVFVSRYHTLISPFQGCTALLSSLQNRLNQLTPLLPLAFRQRQFAPIFGACYNSNVLSSVDADQKHLRNAAWPFFRRCTVEDREQASQEVTLARRQDPSDKRISPPARELHPAPRVLLVDDRPEGHPTGRRQPRGASTARRPNGHVTNHPQTPSLRPLPRRTPDPPARAWLECERGRGPAGTKVLLVEWEEDPATTRSVAGSWTVSWDGKPKHDLSLLAEGRVGRRGRRRRRRSAAPGRPRRRRPRRRPARRPGRSGPPGRRRARTRTGCTSSLGARRRAPPP